MSKVSYVFLALVLIVILFISVFLGSCSLAEQLKSAASASCPAWQYMLTIEYEVISYTDKVISLLLNISPYLGGAHGMTYLKTFNFDLENNRLLELGDIFNPDSDYLAYISGYCRQDLEKQMLFMQTEPDNDWINEGTDPAVLQNYSRFLLGPEGLIIRFEAYQVAPGAAGDFSVLIPYS